MYTARQSSLDRQDLGDYRSELNHFTQTKKIKNLAYSHEEKYSSTTHRMGYITTVSLKHSSSGQTITGKSSPAESKSKAHEQAAKIAWSQVQNIERKMGLSKTTNKGN